MSDNITYDIKKIIRRLEKLERDLDRQLKEIELDLDEVEKGNREILHHIKAVESKLDVLDK